MSISRFQEHRRQALWHARLRQVNPAGLTEWQQGVRTCATPPAAASFEQICFYGNLITPVRAIAEAIIAEIEAENANPFSILEASTRGRNKAIADAIETHVPNVTVEVSRRTLSLRGIILRGLGTAATIQEALYSQSPDARFYPERYNDTILHASKVHMDRLVGLQNAFHYHDFDEASLLQLNERLIAMRASNGRYRIGCPLSFSAATLHRFWTTYASYRRGFEAAQQQRYAQ